MLAGSLESAELREPGHMLCQVARNRKKEEVAANLATWLGAVARNRKKEEIAAIYGHMVDQVARN